MDAETETKVNWRNRYFGDIGAALLSAIPCAAFVSIIDQAVTQNAAKSATLAESVKSNLKQLFFKPTTFLRTPAYLAVVSVYSLTYIAANTTHTWCEKNDKEPDMFVHHRHVTTT